MTILLILVPYGTFSALMLVTSAAVSLFSAVVTFGAVGCCVMLLDPAPGTTAVRLAVDAGIFLVSLVSILIRRPFTLQYALQAVDAETKKVPGFLRANYGITSAWTGLMLVGNIA